MNEQFSRTIAFTITGIYWLVMFVATHLPPSRIPKTGVSDKLAHFGSYAGLAALLLWSLRQSGLPPRASAWWVVAIGLVYAAVDEWLQIVVGRVCSLNDWLADASGIAAVVAVAVVGGAMRHARHA